ncbi:hypothetical protein C7H19_03955 [Aphanothece hegewaldii CCALA 016]|uniref:Uncharacterized protein n=1 Tax=Aphanothece hegewaldii CCALA 016 TaxID=2107694 RepID=A0A2T1M1V3_9CHRO|nr:hypothetical protein [Aphanothece hegewaldii]PSF38670.1 hypothetical protein C7H19_03955 [Aphanothece hegewaldii CCALA 016]
MKLTIRNILYVVLFFCLLLISSFFLLTFAVIYDLADWLFEQSSIIKSKFNKKKFITQKPSEIDDNFFQNNIQELAQKMRS